MLFIFLEGVQIMPSNHLECYLFFRGSTDYAIKSFRILFFLEGGQIMPSNHLQCYLFF
jgi:hypothetical protein